MLIKVVRGEVYQKLTGRGAVLRSCLISSFCATLLLFSGCGMSNNPVAWKTEFNVFPANPTAANSPSSDKATFETNAEGGTVSATSTNVQLSKGTVGGNYRKLRISSSHFVLTGGAIHAP